MARVSIDQQTHGYYQQVSEKRGDVPPLFPTMKDAFMYHFALGVRNGVRESLGKKVDVFQTDVLKADDAALIRAVYLRESGDIMSLDAGEGETKIPEPALEMAEEFANAGAELARRAFSPVKPEESLSYILLDPNAV